MPSRAVIKNLDELLQPIAGDNPAGIDMRESGSSQLSDIRDAAKTARSSERSILFPDEKSEASDTANAIKALESWNEVMKLAPEILAKVSKDLDVACWYTEALIRKKGFPGLRDGIHLIRGLIENFWPKNESTNSDAEEGAEGEEANQEDKPAYIQYVYPLPEDDYQDTVGAINGLNGDDVDGILLAPIRKASITGDHPPGPYNFFHYKQALEVNRVTDEQARAALAKELEISMEQFTSVVLQSQVDENGENFYGNLRDDLQQSVNDYKEISRLLTDRCGINDAPSTSKIISQLEEILGAVKHFAKDLLPIEEEPVEDMEGDGEAVEAGEGGGAKPAAQQAKGPISSREDAFRQVRVIADYLRKTEPHSPIPSLLDKAVRWSNMPFPALMRELIRDETALRQFSDLTGVPTPEDGNNE